MDKIEKLITLIHWTSYAYYVYVFGYASLFKVFQKQSMMDSMLRLGFDQMWTIAIGIGEVVGLALVLYGLIEPQCMNLGVLFLLPFAIGAFATHMAHHEYTHFYNSLIMCVLSVILLATDKNFKIIL